MSKILALFMVLASTLATAQTYPSTVAVHLYGSPEAASFALDRSYDPDQQDRLSLVPTISLYRSGPWSRNSLNWAVVYTPTGDDTTCSAETAGTDMTETWNGSAICGSGLFNWASSQFVTVGAAKYFYDDTLDSTQRKTAVLYRIPGDNHAFNRKYVVFYQTYGLVCF